MRWGLLLAVVVGFGCEAPVSMPLPPEVPVDSGIPAPPLLEDTFTASLFVSTQFGHAETFMQVVGGRPVADVSPRAITVPVVGFSLGSREPSFSERVLRVRNVGCSSSWPIPSSRVEQPHTFELAPGAGVNRFVEFRHDDALLHVATIELDAGTAVSKWITCRLSVVPVQELRLTRFPAGSTGAITFTNTGSTACVIDDLRLEEPGGFALSNAPMQLSLAAGASHTVTVSGPNQPVTTMSTFGVSRAEREQPAPGHYAARRSVRMAPIT